MSKQYAKNQAPGFQNSITKIAIVGAGGQVGKYLVEELLKTGKHQITALTREGSTNKIPDGVESKIVNYDDHASLVSALEGQDAFIITMNVTAPQDTMEKLIRAAAAAKVAWVVPNAYGSDADDDSVNADTMIGLAKKKEIALIEELGVSSWFGICSGFWYEFSLAGGAIRYGFDFENKSVTFYGDGNVVQNTSTWPQTGRAVASLFSLKVLPEDENDKSTTLSEFRNRFARISSYTVTQKDMFASVLRATGTKESDWKINYQPAQERFQKAQAEVRKGNMAKFGEMLYARYFFGDDAGYFEKTKGLDNEKLGLPKEDFEASTRLAVKMVEEDYFAAEKAMFAQIAKARGA